MALFRWQGISPRGEVISGEMEAPTRDAVLARLKGQRIQPIPAKIKERGKGLDKELSIPGLGESVKDRDIVVFTRQLGTMIDAGLPIVQCLDILAAQTENKKLRKVIRQLKDDVEAGSTFTEALRKHNKIFEELYRGTNARSTEGSGLGLALVKRIIALHSGQINVRSSQAEPRGTVFTIRLPVTRRG